MGRKKKREKQQELWVASNEIVRTPGHAFYDRLNTVLEAERFDQRVESLCRRYYKSESRRLSITPGTYFRMLLLGYFEGIGSERGIAWRGWGDYCDLVAETAETLKARNNLLFNCAVYASA